MSLHICTAGRIDLLNNMLGATNGTVKLFTNNHAPADADTPASYTEATFAGYSAVSLSGGSWAGATSGTGQPATANYTPAISWTCTSGTATIYGYYVVSGSDVLWAENWGSVYSLTQGATLTISLQLTFQSLT